MSVSRRLLSAMLRFTYQHDSVTVVLGLALAVMAYVRLVRAGWQVALPWAVAAVLLLLWWWVADQHGYMLFAAEEGPGQFEPARPGTYRALASGRFLQKHWTGLMVRTLVSGEGVQVRWMAGAKPPYLAVLQPWELPASVLWPEDAAERHVLWHPGTEVRLGWVAVGWDVFPGLELRFIGRRLLLAFDEEEQARAVAALLRSAS